MFHERRTKRNRMMTPGVFVFFHCCGCCVPFFSVLPSSDSRRCLGAFYSQPVFFRFSLFGGLVSNFRFPVFCQGFLAFLFFVTIMGLEPVLSCPVLS